MQRAHPVVNGATGTLGISAHNCDQFIAAIQMVLDAMRRFDGQVKTKFCRRFSLKRGTERLPGVALSVEAQGMHFGARHLQNADAMLVTTLQELKIHRWRTCGTVIAYVLIQDALDDGDEPTASRIDRPASNQLLEYS
jgi:hypothetical protein